MSSDYSSFNDKKLLALTKIGNREAYSEIYQRYWPLLYRHAMKMIDDNEESEDIVQDVLVNFWKIAPELPHITSLRAYLYISTRNGVLNSVAKGTVRENYLSDLRNFMQDGYELTDYLVRERILAKLIEIEIQRLPARMREVFELKRKQDLSYREIADKMEISELTVKTQMNKAIYTLRSKFGDQLSIFIPFL